MGEKPIQVSGTQNVTKLIFRSPTCDRAKFAGDETKNLTLIQEVQAKLRIFY